MKRGYNLAEAMAYVGVRPRSKERRSAWLKAQSGA